MKAAAKTMALADVTRWDTAVRFTATPVDHPAIAAVAVAHHHFTLANTKWQDGNKTSDLIFR